MGAYCNIKNLAKCGKGNKNKAEINNFVNLLFILNLHVFIVHKLNSSINN